jgi:outer membrane biogenesis lipoprotein LolB
MNAKLLLLLVSLLLTACSFGIGVTNAPALDPCDNVPRPQICH